MSRTRAAVVTCVLAVWAVGTMQRVAVWQTERTLWGDAVRVTPTRPRPVMNYGRALELDGDLDGAMRQFRAVIPLTFDARRGVQANRFALAAAETNIAHLYLKTGQKALAFDTLMSTLAWWPDFIYARYNLGRIFWEGGACAEGLQQIQFARQTDPALSLPNEPCATSTP